jgi:Rad3-related DNA helicase
LTTTIARRGEVTSQLLRASTIASRNTVVLADPAKVLANVLSRSSAVFLLSATMTAALG